MVHIKKEKGDDAVARAIADLTIKRYSVFMPVITEHLPFDLIAYKDNISLRIQAKYSSDGFIQNKTSWSDKNGAHVHKYNSNDFDYYAIYLPNIDKMIYPSINFGGCSIATILPNSATPFYWWEDFLSFTDKDEKRNYKDFGKIITRDPSDKTRLYHESKRKIQRPSKEELMDLLWKKPTSQIAKDFSVSDKAVEKWAKTYCLTKPPRGYWNKKSS